MTPSVSVIIPFYNAMEFVDRAIDQCASLTLEDVAEIILIDDGSTDGTVAAIEARISDLPKARLIAQSTNRGVAEVRNLGVRAATGDYIWFADCDDVWAPAILRHLLNLQASSQADIITCGATRVRDPEVLAGKRVERAPEGVYSGDDAVLMLLRGQLRGYLWNKLIRRTWLARSAFPNRRAQEDFAVVASMLFDGAVIAVTHFVCYHHVVRPMSLTNSPIASLDDLRETCDEVVRQVGALGDQRDFAVPAAFFRQWYFRSSAVNTVARLGADNEGVSREIAEIQRSITLRDLRAVAVESRREFVIAALMRTLGPVYAYLYRAYLGISAVLEKGVKPPRQSTSRSTV